MSTPGLRRLFRRLRPETQLAVAEWKYGDTGQGLHL
jgi:hypothetical protein